MVDICPTRVEHHLSPNIKKDAVHALACTAAARTGLSQASVIEEALTMYQAHLDDPTEAQARRRRALLEQLDAELDDRARARFLDKSDLCDDAGLPS